MRIGQAYSCTLPSGQGLRFEVVALHDRPAGGVWVVEDGKKRWMFGKGSWIELNSIEVAVV
jgi:hypothetical protein